MTREQALKFEGFDLIAAGAPDAPPRTPTSPLTLAQVSKILRDRLHSRRYIRLMAICGDLLALSIAFLSGSLLRFGDPLHGQAFNTLGVMLPIYMIVAINSHAFGLNSVVRARVGIGKALMAFLGTLSVVGLVVFFLKASSDFSRVVFGVGAVAAFFLIPLFRVVTARLSRWLFGTDLAVEVAIEDGVDLPKSGAMVLNCRELGLAPQLDDPMMLDRLGRYLEGADRVVVACSAERRALWAVALKGADINAEVIAPELDQLGALGISNFDGQSTLMVAASPLGVVDRTLKRTLDVCLTLAVMPIALPIMAGVAIAVRLDSPGPILFKQQRVGLGNRIFQMYKFRSMYSDRGDALGDRSAGRNDDRVTRVGRFIRAASLDELPQLFNVLSGAMSIVGPRPHPLLCKADNRLFWDIDLTYCQRHAVKPGLTGLAQVRGFRGATEKESDLTNRLQADLEYLSGWSIWRDLAIIVATVRVIKHQNAF